MLMVLLSLIEGLMGLREEQLLSFYFLSGIWEYSIILN
ncbi:hypothetical protein J5U22_02316 [Saccharolobus shibatae]|uniref:Uncharacterized protein n=1 Tax=Saccharolobus shibatae TaxID=2286 RepID=A0A8F5BWF2_9CREN|nr:hypothetical protein J5U21_02296 [Saccharolobus shibatae]QXJ35769.1 hypothetical protein J5U22_02316 [Saccharolobus shibatae]